MKLADYQKQGLKLGLADVKVIPMVTQWEYLGVTTCLGQHDQKLLDEAKYSQPGCLAA